MLYNSIYYDCKKNKTTGAGTGDKEEALAVKWSKKIFCDGGWIFFLIMMW